MWFRARITGPVRGLTHGHLYQGSIVWHGGAVPGLRAVVWNDEKRWATYGLEAFEPASLKG